jgi:hypothetical protein
MSATLSGMAITANNIHEKKDITWKNVPTAISIVNDTVNDASEALE